MDKEHTTCSNEYPWDPLGANPCTAVGVVLQAVKTFTTYIPLTSCPQCSMSNVPQNHGNNSQPHQVIGMSYALGVLVYLCDRQIMTSYSNQMHNGSVRVWNLETRLEEETTMQHETGMWGLSVIRDDSKIISFDGKRIIKVWDIGSHHLIKEWTHPKCISSISISPDDQFVAVDGGIVTIYSVEEGMVVGHSIEVSNYVSCLAFSPGRDKLTCNTNHDIHIYV